jgi:Ni,Fe-hydrogenase I large subunit
VQTIFGGKNPHPNFLVGGVPSAISVHTGAGTGTTAVNVVGLQKVAEIIEQMRNFVDQVYLPDTLAIASFYKDWFKTAGRRHRQFHDLRGFSRRWAARIRRPSWCRAARFWAAICPTSRRST